MPNYHKFDCFVADEANGVHNLGSNTLQVLLTNTQPNRADTAVDTTASPLIVASVSNAPAIPMGTPTELSIWSNSDTPANQIPGSGQMNYTFGCRFRSTIDTAAIGVRFYKATGASGAHIGKIWADDGTPLASKTFSGETSSGWQSQLFDTPLAITADTVYVVGYSVTDGYYCYDLDYFTSGPHTNGTLSAIQDGDGGVNGCYIDSPGAVFPSKGNPGVNFWADVIVGTSSFAATLTISSSAQSAGLYKLIATALTVPFSADSDPFRYMVLFNNSARTATARPVIGWWDYGSPVVVSGGNSFVVPFNQVNGVLQAQ